jgi:hypothetical protein
MYLQTAFAAEMYVVLGLIFERRQTEEVENLWLI